MQKATLIVEGVGTFKLDVSDDDVCHITCFAADPAETVIDGIVHFKPDVNFKKRIGLVGYIEDFVQEPK